MSGGERGTVTLWVLGLCVGLLFLGGLSLDSWRAIARRRELSAMADATATAAANGVDESALRAGTLRIDPSRARGIAAETLAEYPREPDAARVDTTDASVTVTLRAHVIFSLLGIFMHGQRFEIEVHASARPLERS